MVGLCSKTRKAKKIFSKRRGGRGRGEGGGGGAYSHFLFPFTQWMVFFLIWSKGKAYIYNAAHNIIYI